MRAICCAVGLRSHDGPAKPTKLMDMSNEPFIAEITELCARAAHEINRVYCLALGDTSQMAWDDAPDWQRESCRTGVRAVLANPEQTPEQSHESWLATKVADGWVYGVVKDATVKTHPCVLPYGELSPSARAKDAIFVAVVRGIHAQMAGGL